MLLRDDGRGVLAIGQASHARLSGQLARAWGNERFGHVHPHEETCMAAEQHDVGMAAWDLAPSFNPDTGRPHSFTEMPLEVHLRLWTAAPRRLLTQSRYAALLVSMHGRRLYEMRDLDEMTPEDADAVRAFIEDQNGFQERLLGSLRRDPRTAPESAPELVERNSDLIWTWDYLSLALCLDWAPGTAGAVPTAAGKTEVRLIPGDGGTTVEPWPFAMRETLTVRCEGRRLTEPAADAEELARALTQAPWETAEFELRAPRG